MASFLGEIDKLPARGYHADDVCNSYRNENRKKDEIIQQLCKINPNGHVDVGCTKPHHQTSYSDVASLQVKIDNLEEKLRRKQTELNASNEQAAIARKEREIHRMEAEKLEGETRKLTATNAQLQSSVETFESLRYRSDYSIKHLQDQYQTSQTRVAELEARIKTQATEREKLDFGKCSAESKYQNFLMSLAQLVAVGDFTNTEAIMDNLRYTSEQNALLNGKVQVAEQRAAAAEEEARMSRETIVKLMREYEGVGRGKENLRETKTQLSAENEDMRNQLELLTKRQESLQKLYDGARSDGEDKTSQMLDLEVKLRQQEFATQSSGTIMRSLLECLATSLSTPFVPCAPTESAVKERLAQIVQKLRDQSSAAETLDQRVLQLQKQFETQYETGKSLLDKSRDAEGARQDLESRIRALENDLEAQHVLKDNIRCEKERISKGICQLAEVLQIDYLPSDTDSLGLLGLLSERCGELAQSGSSCWRCCPKMARGASVDNSQKQARRVTGLKEELEAKQLQIQLLERRLAGQTTSLSDCQPPLTCRGDETNRDRVHRLQHQLEDSQLEIEELRRALLKCQASEYELHKQDKLKQNDELDQLSGTVEKLDKVRQRQAKKISTLKSQMEAKEGQLQSHSKRDGDLKQARLLLEETRKRELELVNLRDSLAQMLGVDVRCSSDPHSEIRARLHKLLTMARSSTTTPFSPYYLSQELPAAFQTGYQRPVAQLGLPRPASMATASCDVVGGTNDSSMVNLHRRQQMPRNRIAFQTTPSLTTGSAGPCPHRARSSSPGKRDERKY